MDLCLTRKSLLAQVGREQISVRLFLVIRLAFFLHGVQLFHLRTWILRLEQLL